MGGSDDCARGGDTSSSRSLRPWPRSGITHPCRDRRRPGPGRRITRCASRRRSGRTLLTSGTEFFSLDLEDVLAAGSRPTVCLTCLVRRSGFCGALWSSLPTVPVVPLLVETFVTVPFLDVLVPQTVDNSVPEQVIEVPKISQDPQPAAHVVLRAAAAGEVLVTSPGDCVITATLREVVLARFWATDGLTWCQCPEPQTSSWWLGGTRHTVDTPGGTHRQPRTGFKFWASLTRVRFRPLVGSSCDHAAQVPAVRPREGGGASDSVPRQIASASSCATETGTHSVKLCRKLEIPQRSSWWRTFLRTGSDKFRQFSGPLVVPQIRSSTEFRDDV